MRPAKIAILTVSDRASRGEYPDTGGPGAEAWLRGVITSPLEIRREIPMWLTVGMKLEPQAPRGIVAASMQLDSNPPADTALEAARETERQLRALGYL